MSNRLFTSERVDIIFKALKIVEDLFVESKSLREAQAKLKAYWIRLRGEGDG